VLGFLIYMKGRGWWVVHGLHRKDSGEWGCGGV
jgi:hypothetical protein